MKRLLIILLILTLTGCASTQVATRIGDKVGGSFRSSAATGLSSADSIKSWPYVSGQIRGIYADNYNLEVPLVMQGIIAKLDELAIKETLTDQEKGMVIGYYVRLEALAAEFGWNKYGVSIYGMLVKLAGG